MQEFHNLNSKVVVEVNNISKKFCKNFKRSLFYGLKDIGQELMSLSSRRSLRKDEFWALQGVSFELREGECLGLIGRNGSGKTTLLRIINELIKPDIGNLKIKGRIGALIALGTGFNPLLTGRENMFINGAVLGISHSRIKSKEEEIIDFAGIHDFIDAPVRSYSSGMVVRLGFAIASILAPEIIILDEVLAVGDFAFQQKCLAQISKLKDQGTSSILVSHNMIHITQYADRCLWLEKGKVVDYGDTKLVCEKYVDKLKSEAESASDKKSHMIGSIYGNIIPSHPEISNILVDLEVIGRPSIHKTLPIQTPVHLNFSFDLNRSSNLDITFNIFRKDGLKISVINNLLDNIQIHPNSKQVFGSVNIDHLNFTSGEYVIVMVIIDKVEFLYRDIVSEFTISKENQQGDIYESGIIQTPHKWVINN